MSNTKKTGALIFLILGLLAIIPMASGLSTLQLRPGQRFTLDSDEAAAAEEEVIEEETSDQAAPALIRNTLLVFLAVFLPLSLIVALRSPELFKEVLKRDLRLFLLFLAGFFVIRQLQLQGFFNRPDLDAATGTIISIPDLIQNPTVMMGFVMAFILLGLFTFSMWKLWQRVSPMLTVSQIAQDAIEDIQSGVDLRDVIVRCYYDMCRALQSTGRWARSKATTPRELAAQLENAGIAGEQTARLTRLFERVRYGGQDLGKAEEQEAIECLQAIVAAMNARQNRYRDPLPALGFKRVPITKQ